jgi:hypothetical protein
MFVLSALLAFLTGDLELWLHPFCRMAGFLKILRMAWVTLLALGCYCFYKRKKATMGVAARIKRAIVITFLLSPPMYIMYAERIISNVLINGTLRNHLAARIHPCTDLANGMQADGLTAQEYQLVASSIGFPSVPSTAGNIAYWYAYDDFLPDYSLKLSYDVPGY